MFEQARELMASGRIAEACAAFDASQRLAPTIPTLLNQANCREKNGQLATAWGLFREAERQTRSASDEAQRQHHDVASERARKLESRISKLTISVSADSRVERLEIVRGEDRIEEAMWNRALPVDGGTYKITARAPSSTEWSATVVVATESDTKTVDIPKLQIVAPPKPDGREDEAEPVAARSNVLPLAIAGGAVLALGSALGFELSARATYEDAHFTVEPDPAKQDALWRSANLQRHVAQGLAVVGVAGAGVAVWLYLRNRTLDARLQARRGIDMQPIAGADALGIGISWRY